MNLIPTYFGMNHVDPAVPGLEFLGPYDTSDDNTTYLVWESTLPEVADESIIAVPLGMRADVAVLNTATAAGVTQPWSVYFVSHLHKVVMLIECEGRVGWNDELSPPESQAIAARAAHICATGWAAWHASGHTWDTEHALGVMWLVGAGFPWPDAVKVAGQLAAA